MEMRRPSLTIVRTTSVFPLEACCLPALNLDIYSGSPAPFAVDVHPEFPAKISTRPDSRLETDAEDYEIVELKDAKMTSIGLGPSIAVAVSEAHLPATDGAASELPFPRRRRPRRGAYLSDELPSRVRRAGRG